MISHDHESFETEFDLVIVGGVGRVGLPLGLVFADKGLNVALYDKDTRRFETIRQGIMPFVEYDAEPILKSVIGKKLFVSSDISVLSRAKVIIISIGTPVDEYLNPKLRTLLELFSDLGPYIDKRQTIIIRSTVYPGTCKQVAKALSKEGEVPWNLAYCPERIAEGHAIRELKELPQLVAGLTEKAIHDADNLFSLIAARVIRVAMEEAELAKLFSNAWRYIQFAVANQFYMMAQDFGADFNKVRKALVDGYGRAANLPTAGFAAGPCLLKDTMQLAAFDNSKFQLGHAAMMINEGLPNFLIENLRRRYDLNRTRVGILGMAFKGDIDDTRDSLSYKIGKILRFYGAEVFYSDEFVQDPTFVSKEELVVRCDVVIVGAPHSTYKEMQIPEGVDIVDMWGILPKRGDL